MSGKTTYRNPIVSGFNPDPSVVHVDGVFYLVTSTFHVFPGLPVYASTDLKTWKLIGHGLHRQEQLSLFHANSRLVHLDTGEDMVATGGLQAPTIRHHKGKFYLVGTNISRPKTGSALKQNFILSTTDIWSGEWSDPVFFDFNGIDTSFFVDDDERVYVQGAWMHDRREQPTSTIYQLEMDLNTGKALSDTRLIWEGHFRYDTEGPHIYKRGEYYYLIAAEGGTFEHHKLSIARSKNIWGPYDSYEQNPILTADGTDEEIQGLGHGELFQDADGDWWIVALGFRSRDDAWPLGRETFLSKVEWPEGGWPKVEQPKLSFQGKKLPSTELSRAKTVSELLHIRGRVGDNYQIEGEGEQQVIRLRPGSATIGDAEGIPTFLGKRQQELSSVAQVVLDISSAAAGAAAKRRMTAGLAVYTDPLRYASLAFDFGNSLVRFGGMNVPRRTTQEASYGIDSSVTAVKLKIESNGTDYVMSFLQIGPGTTEGSEKEWKIAGSVGMKDLWARFFTGPMFGIFVDGEADAADTMPEATFLGFEVEAHGDEVASRGESGEKSPWQCTVS